MPRSETAPAVGCSRSFGAFEKHHYLEFKGKGLLSKSVFRSHSEKHIKGTKVLRPFSLALKEKKMRKEKR